MILPGHNAHLTLVQTPGTDPDFDQAAGSPSTKWAGDCEAQVDERLMEEANNGRLDIVRSTTMTLPNNFPVPFVPNDILTFKSIIDGVTQVRRVRAIQRPVGAFLCRLELWDV